jgi:hypothetical protein
MFWRREAGGNKRLVDHIGPAKFSHLGNKRKISLTIAPVRSEHRRLKRRRPLYRVIQASSAAFKPIFPRRAGQWQTAIKAKRVVARKAQLLRKASASSL